MKLNVVDPAIHKFLTNHNSNNKILKKFQLEKLDMFPWIPR